MFQGLLAPSLQLSALWGLGTELGDTRWLVARTLAGSALLILSTIGYGYLLAKREFAQAITIAMFAGAALILALHHQYSYGAYKMIAIGWWAIAWALVRAVVWMRAWPDIGRGASSVAVLVCAAVPLSGAARAVVTSAEAEPLLLSSYRVLERLGDGHDGQPIGVFTEDVLASHWAVYFLRDDSIKLAAQRVGYLGMPHVQQLLDDSAEVAWSDVRLLLRDAEERDPFDEDQGWRQRWRRDPYAVWEPPADTWVIAQVARAGNGIEAVDGRPFFWIGGLPFEVVITSPRTGAVELSATFVAGPSIDPATRGRRVAIAGGAAPPCLEVVHEGPSAVYIPVTAGDNHVSIEAVDPIAIPVQANGDTRPLALGVVHPQIRFLTELPPAASGRCIPMP
jgi:hypothetical protein